MSWPVLRHYTGICREGPRKTEKNKIGVRNVGLQAEIRTGDFRNTTTLTVEAGG